VKLVLSVIFIGDDILTITKIVTDCADYGMAPNFEGDLGASGQLSDIFRVSVVHGVPPVDLFIS
jgi:hypothetical protein